MMSSLRCLSIGITVNDGSLLGGILTLSSKKCFFPTTVKSIFLLLLLYKDLLQLEEYCVGEFSIYYYQECGVTGAKRFIFDNTDW